MLEQIIEFWRTLTTRGCSIWSSQHSAATGKTIRPLLPVPSISSAATYLQCVRPVMRESEHYQTAHVSGAGTKASSGHFLAIHGSSPHVCGLADWLASWGSAPLLLLLLPPPTPLLHIFCCTAWALPVCELQRPAQEAPGSHSPLRRSDTLARLARPSLQRAFSTPSTSSKPYEELRQQRPQHTPSPPLPGDKHPELPFLKELRASRAPFVARLASRATEPATLVTLIVLTLLVTLPFILPRPYNDLLFNPFRTSYHIQPPASCPSPNPFVQELYCRAPPHVTGSLYNQSPQGMALQAAAERVAAEFEYTKEDVNRGVKEFIREMEEGLVKTGATMSQIPTYVTAVPNGTEKGLYMAVDLGGTNFRVCSIQLHGNSTFSLTQSKVKIPNELMVAKTSHELFAFLAKQIELFLQTHHGFTGHTERKSSVLGGKSEQEVFSLGFTFSFPVQQFGINKGTLIRWTKGFDIDDTIGKDVCALLQAEIDALGLPVRVAALVNDTVGTLMARSYTSPGKTGTLLGAIFGTGTNGAYVEKLGNVTKLGKMGAAAAAEIDRSTGEMIINTEWGSFDNHLSVLPNTPYDRDLDRESNNPGIQMFEKRVSGMFLGEILRRALVALMNDNSVPLFDDTDSDVNDLHSTTDVASNSPLYRQWGLDTSFLSIASGDSSAGLKVTRQTLDKEYGVSAASAEDAEAVRLIASAVGKRAARLSAVAIAAVVISTDKLSKPAKTAATRNTSPEPNEDNMIDIGVDGSLVEFYPRFEEYIREALQDIPEIGPVGEKRIRIGIAKDGSGVGAALIALVADRAMKGRYPSSHTGIAGFFQRVFAHVNRGVRTRV